MFEEVYCWLESYCGSRCDPSDQIAAIEYPQAFVDPYSWCLNIRIMADTLVDAFETIDLNRDSIPDTMPDATIMKKLLRDQTRDAITANMRVVRNKLNMSKIIVVNMDDFIANQLFPITDLIRMCIDNDSSEIVGHLFDDYENEHEDNGFMETLDISKEDIPEIALTIKEERENYFASNEE
jgi:hypothetical protein